MIAKTVLFDDSCACHSSPSDLTVNCDGMGLNLGAFNSTGHPALTINAGFSAPDVTCKGGLPKGMMIVGKQYDEVTVLQVARAFEKLRK
jgi:amidase